MSPLRSTRGRVLCSLGYVHAEPRGDLTAQPLLPLDSEGRAVTTVERTCTRPLHA
jgi:hypothetical protein